MKTSSATKKYLINFKAKNTSKKGESFFRLANKTIRAQKTPKKSKTASAFEPNEVDKIVYDL